MTLQRVAGSSGGRGEDCPLLQLSHKKVNTECCFMGDNLEANGWWIKNIFICLHESGRLASDHVSDLLDHMPPIFVVYIWGWKRGNKEKEEIRSIVFDCHWTYLISPSPRSSPKWSITPPLNLQLAPSATSAGGSRRTTAMRPEPFSVSGRDQVVHNSAWCFVMPL